jgi:FtsP/CotA-like multicopper oxidase with cupredoxin domain
MNRNSARVVVLRVIVLMTIWFGLPAPRAGAEDVADDVCPRPSAASVASQSAEIHSQNGRLELTLNFKIATDTRGRVRFCYMSDNGLQSPTLRVKPGDELILHLRNQLPGNSGEETHHHAIAGHDPPCADGRMSLAATNLHFHGLSLPPTCHQDDVMRTLIEPSATFDYHLKIPADTPPGLYWYHPHPHPFSEAQVLGGASGALIVGGIENFYPELNGLQERVLILRDQQLPIGTPKTNPNTPSWDVSLNYVPVLYPDYVPAVIKTSPHREEFWRILNAAANTIFDLQVIAHDQPQPLRLVAIDGVPLKNSLRQTEVLLPPGSRAEFVVATPGLGEHAQLVTQAWDTGPDGDKDVRRVLADVAGVDLPKAKPKDVKSIQQTHDHKANFSGLTDLRSITPTTQRELYFSEKKYDPENFGNTSFFLTVEGQKPGMFKMDAPPDIITRQGSVEDWVVENRSREEHIFHIHQIHFQLLEKDGKPVDDPALRDTVDIPYWKGSGPYPSVKLRMDFRDPNVIGTFMYHCHILQHGDNGMMGVIQVLPPEKANERGN